MNLDGATWGWAPGDPEHYGFDGAQPRSRRNRAYLGTWTLVYQNCILATLEGHDEGSHECWIPNLATNVGPPAPNGRRVEGVAFYNYTTADAGKAALMRFLDGLIPPPEFQLDDF